MLKNMVCLDATIQGKESFFFCESDTTTPIVKEMLFHYLKYVGQVEDQAAAQKKDAEEIVNAEPVGD